MELSMLGEVLLHVLGYKNLNRFLIINTAQALFTIFAVIEFYPSHKWVMCFMAERALSKLVRYMYNTYTTMGYKFSFYPFEWVRMSLFYILYPLESFFTIIIILATLPVVKTNESLVWEIRTFVDINIDFTILYFIFMVAGLPNFLTTIVYLHRKRQQ